MNPSYAVVPIIGCDGAGKTTLAQAIATRASVEPRPIVVDGWKATAIDVQGPSAVYQFIDFANFETQQSLLAPSRFRGAVLVVSGPDSVLPQTRDSLVRAQQCGIPILAAALTKCDALDDEEMLDLVSMEVSELMSKYGGFGDRPIIRTPGRAGRMREREEPGPGQGLPQLMAVVCR